MTKVLLVSYSGYKLWLGRLIKSLRNHDKDMQIDMFFTDSVSHENMPSFAALCSNVYCKKRYFPGLFYKLPYIRRVFSYVDTILTFKRFSSRIYESQLLYDIINIHYLSPYHNHIINYLVKISQKIMLTPWGSDVLRTNGKSLEKLKKMVNVAQFVTCGADDSRFRQDVIRLLDVPADKISELRFGSELIDEIITKKEITRDVAKREFGIQGKYVIACGYNASPAQNHLDMIDAIASVKEKLPTNMLLFFPMTYGVNETYVYKVEQKLKELDLPYLIFTEYLSNDKLLSLRKSADMFIHAQKTDANSGSLAEYLLCEAKVINASWLKYPHREKYGKPYYIFESFDELGEVIVKAYNAKESLISNDLLRDIQKDGWNTVGKEWVNFYNSCKNDEQ